MRSRSRKFPKKLPNSPKLKLKDSHTLDNTIRLYHKTLNHNRKVFPKCNILIIIGKFVVVPVEHHK